MPQSIPSGLGREHVLQALAELDAGVAHPFAASTGYELVENGRRYAPKAVIGLAFRRVLGGILQPDEFSGGEAPGQANFVLRKLGFTVVRKVDAGEREAELLAGSNWTEQEVSLVVADYFSMLEAEMYRRPFSKSAHRKLLAPQLHGRSEGSIEFKHQNVSGVLVERGLPYIEGYKPRSNYQGILADAVEDFLAENSRLLAKLENAPAVHADQVEKKTDFDLNRIIEDPPERIFTPKAPRKPWLSRKGMKIDFAERDAANRHLGRLGEQFILAFERNRLKRAGRDDLAKRVQWASQEIGDGLGFDIRSFDCADESELMLEVKTTGLGKFFPFYVTDNEVRCSDDVPQQYQLCRVFNFSREPRLYILHGSLREHCQLQPVVYRAIV